MIKIISMVVPLLVLGLFVADSDAALINNVNGTITDISTNLMWSQSWNVLSGRDTWYDAASYVGDTHYNYNDWRFATGDELMSLWYLNSEQFTYDTSYGAVLEPFQISTDAGFLDLWTTEVSATTASVYSISAGPIQEGRYQDAMDGGIVLDKDYYPAQDGEGPYGLPMVRNITTVPEPLSLILFIAGGSILASRSPFFTFEPLATGNSINGPST